MNENTSFFQGTSKANFYLGLFLGIAAMSTLGLAIILSMVFNGKFVNAQSGSPSVVAQAPARPVPSAAADNPNDAPPSAPVKPIDASDHVLGPKDAKVTVIEYSDFECPFCKRFYPTTKQILKDYPKDVRLAFRHFPLSFHQNAQKEAEASECAGKVGGNDAFWKFHDKIFERTTSNGTGFALDALVPLAKEIGLDEQKFKSCLDSGEMAGKVAQQMQDGSSAGVSGTPAMFINGQLISGAVPYEQIKSAIDAVLKK